MDNVFQLVQINVAMLIIAALVCLTVLGIVWRVSLCKLRLRFGWWFDIGLNDQKGGKDEKAN